MPHMIESFVQNYGYLAVFFGTLAEGETILVVAGFLAHRGYMELPGVWLAAFLGTLCSDQLFYYLGRRRGTDFIARRPAWRARSQRVFDLLHRHQIWVILGFRFLYGVRTLTPLVIGASRVPPLRFLALNAVGGAVWAVVIGTLGYLIGNAVETALGEVRRYEVAVLLAIVTAGVLAWAVYLFRQVMRRDR